MTQGSLAGLVYKGGTWKSDFDEIIKKGKIALFQEKDGGRYIQTLSSTVSGCDGGGDDARGFTADQKHPTEQAYSYSFLLKCTNDGNGLTEGRYVIIFAHTEKGDPLGNAKPENPLTNIFDVEFEGELTFDLMNNPNNDGYGLITFINPDGTHEPGNATSTDIKDVNSNGGINIDVTETSIVESAFADAMNSVINSVLSMITKVVTWGGNLIHRMLIVGNDIEVDDDGTTEGKLGIRAVWEKTRNMGLSLLTLALLLVAFANILSIELDKYGLTRMIPKIIIAIVLTYFSYFIAAFLLDLMSALQALLFGGASNMQYFQIGTSINGKIIGEVGAGYDAANIASKLPELLFLVIIGIFVALVVIWLLLVLLVRNSMIFVLVAVAPLAFLAMIFPFTEKYYKQWWSTFWKWAFIGPAIAFMLWLTQQFLGGYAASTYNGDSNVAWTYLIVAAVMIWLTATLPLKMGNEIYSAIGKHADKVPGVKEGKAFMAQRKSAIDKRAAMRGNKLWAGVAQVPGLRRLAAGVDRKGSDAARESLKGAFKENFVKLTKDQLNTSLNEGKYKGLEAEAAYDYLAGLGQLDMDKANVAKYVAERASTDGGFLNIVKDKQVDAFAKITTLASEGKLSLSEKARNGARAEADKSIAGKAGFELKPAQIEHLAKNNPEYLQQLLGDKNYIKGIMEKGGPGAKAAWGEAVKYATPTSTDRELSGWYAELASTATVTEERARTQAAMPETQGGKSDANKGKNAWGEANSQRPNPYQPTQAGRGPVDTNRGANPTGISPTSTAQPRPSSQQNRPLPDSINEDRYAPRESGILTPKEQDGGSATQSDQTTGPQQTPDDTEN
jgi:hypothetical protein